MTIAIEYDLLKEAWESFSDASQGKKSIGDSKKAAALKWTENHTIEELRNTVLAAAENLDESHGKTRQYFDKICSNLSSHSAILEVLPNQSQYLSIFCGVVKTLLKVKLWFAVLYTPQVTYEISGIRYLPEDSRRP